jgi:hypothetical protein
MNIVCSVLLAGAAILAAGTTGGQTVVINEFGTRRRNNADHAPPIGLARSIDQASSFRARRGTSIAISFSTVSQ